MKNMLAFALIICTFLFSSCTKSGSSSGSTSRITVDASIASGEIYQLNLSQYGNRAAIIKQAVNYTESTINNSTSTPVYKYSYTTKSAITEQVQLAVTKANTNNRCNKPNDSTIVTVNLSIQ